MISMSEAFLDVQKVHNLEDYLKNNPSMNVTNLKVVPNRDNFRCLLKRGKFISAAFLADQVYAETFQEVALEIWTGGYGAAVQEVKEQLLSNARFDLEDVELLYSLEDGFTDDEAAKALGVHILEDLFASKEKSSLPAEVLFKAINGLDKYRYLNDNKAALAYFLKYGTVELFVKSYASGCGNQAVFPRIQDPWRVFPLWLEHLRENPDEDAVLLGEVAVESWGISVDSREDAELFISRCHEEDLITFVASLLKYDGNLEKGTYFWLVDVLKNLPGSIITDVFATLNNFSTHAVLFATKAGHKSAFLDSIISHEMRSESVIALDDSGFFSKEEIELIISRISGKEALDLAKSVSVEKLESWDLSPEIISSIFSSYIDCSLEVDKAKVLLAKSSKVKLTTVSYGNFTPEEWVSITDAAPASTIFKRMIKRREKVLEKIRTDARDEYAQEIHPRDYEAFSSLLTHLGAPGLTSYSTRPYFSDFDMMRFFKEMDSTQKKDWFKVLETSNQFTGQFHSYTRNREEDALIDALSYFLASSCTDWEEVGTPLKKAGASWLRNHVDTQSTSSQRDFIFHFLDAWSGTLEELVRASEKI